MSLKTVLKKLADAAIADWPEISFSGQFETGIEDLYRSQLQFPPSWPQDRRDDFITDNAYIDVIRLTTKFDDAIDTAIDHYTRRHGDRPHHEDATEMIAAERRTAIYELEFYLASLSDEIAVIAAHTPGRAEVSMTGCSPAHRRSQAGIKPTRHGRRRRR